MPRSELHPLAEGTLPSTQPRMTTALPNLTSMSDGGFVELVWENGQLLLRGASTTTQKSPSCIGISSHTSNAVENVGGDSFNTKSARYDSRDSPLLGPPALKELSKHDKNMPYLNYPHTDSLQEYAYLPELLNESYEPTPNALTQHYDAAVLDKSCRPDKQLMDSNIVSLHDNLNLKQRKTFKFLGAEPQLTKPRSSQLYRSSLQHCQSSAPFTRSQGLDFTCGNTNSSHLLIPPSSTPVSMGGLCNSKMQEQDPGPKRKMGLANFSHSLRPSIQSSGGTKPTTSPGLSRVEELKNNGFQNQPVSMATKAELIQSIAKSPKEPLPDENSEAVCQEDVSRKNGSPNHVLGRASSFATSAAKGNPNSEKSIKALVATSSFCSHGASNDPIYYSKRKYQDSEESAYLSENVEEPEDVIKTVLARGNTGAKRGRTAEVHNLSERRRRDKINKKIRALRELIPNCNKVDKASMLDEVIEYLKTLQLQIQIMSMRTGFCMPPMMLPTGMQHIHVPHTHFSPMGVGMGMRVGMGTYFRPAQFPSFISGATALPGITGTTLQMLGLPSQMLPMSSSCPPFIPLPVGSSTQSLPVPVVSGATSPVEHPPSTPTPCSKVEIQKISLDTLHNEKILNAQGTKQRVR